MRSIRAVRALLILAGTLLTTLNLAAQSPPVLTPVSTNLGQANISFPPYPAVQSYTFLSGTNISLPLTPNTNFAPAPYNVSTNITVFGTNSVTNVYSSYAWRLSNAPPIGFYTLQITPLTSNAVLAATVLNRLAYGQTPDELERVLTGSSPIGPQGFINEQLAPWNVTETVDTYSNIAAIQSKFVEAATPMSTNGASTNYASINDLRAWHVMRAVGAKRQLLEILLQFWENHFVTYYDKTVMYFDGFGLDSTTETRVATQFEYLENEKWRNAMLNPNCTFYDLLKISAESPAMIIYLDTVLSKGSGTQVANENYARELMELFTMGVNNGYDQNDITIESRCWTGWSVQKVDPTNAFNPHGAILPGSVNTNVGVWALNYKPGDHNTNSKTIFPGKTVPARFGAPWAGLNYQIVIPSIAQTNVNGMLEGYTIITNYANLPFTEEFISCKLCNLFVHDGFTIGTDFTQTNLTPEQQLVHSCMMTWETSTPKGQIWLVLSNIFNSDLFRGNGAAMQKVKTPLEYTVSAIRVMRASTNGTGNFGTFAGDTDGYSISGAGSTYPLERMGNMLLFDRQSPDGYPEDAPGWISGGTLAERIRWLQTYCMAANDSSKSDGISGGNKSICDPVGLLKYKLPLQNPPGSITNEANVADYLLSIFYPGEGAGNLALYRSAMITYLKTADDGVTSSPLGSLSQTGNPSAYETRIRGGVAMLLGFQRFQEQ